MFCQKCRASLKPDGSLEDLNPAAFDLLVGSTGKPPLDSTKKNAHPPRSPEGRALYDAASRRSTAPVYKYDIPSSRHGSSVQFQPGAKDGPGMSFVMLTESQVAPAQAAPEVNGDGHAGHRTRLSGSSELTKHVGEQSLSDEAEKAARLFEIISARSDIDHPICGECTDLLVEGLQKRLLVATKERDAYISFLRTLNASTPAPEEVAAAEQSLNTTLKAESEAFRELQGLEKEKAEIDKEITALEEQSRQLDLEEENFWRDRNTFSLTLSEFQNERDALNVKYDHDSRQLDRLQRTNVYNDTFCIGHDGYFGTINGLRLGRLANPSVDWAEINAAWGQTILLLATLADKLGFQFQGYRLRPMGSVSKIDKVEYPQQSATPINSMHQSARNTNQTDYTGSPKITSLDLFSSGDLPLNFPWLHRRFDTGMVAFLECLRQLGVHVEKTTTSASSSSSPLNRPSPHQRRSNPTAELVGLRLPYEIKRDKIGDATIKLGFNQNDETWTRACKYTLTCCKFLLAHASNVAGARPSSAAPGDASGGRQDT